MLESVQGYEVFVKINNGRIIVYDIDYDTKEIDWNSVSILSSVDEKFAAAICTALDIESIEKYEVTIYKGFNHEH